MIDNTIEFMSFYFGSLKKITFTTNEIYIIIFYQLIETR